jgi:hypothetical protein
MNWLRRRSPGTLYGAFLALFVVSRIAFFALTTAGEYRLYKSYGDEARRTSLDDLYRHRVIEYPHLGVAFGAVAGFAADNLPNWAKHLVRIRPNKWDLEYLEDPQELKDDCDQYEAALGLLLLGLDCWCLWLVFAIVRRVYPHDDALTRVARLFAYALCSGLTGLIIYDRQDLVVSWLALLAIWSLTVKWPRLGYALLVIGTAYKLVPALLLPVWVLAATVMKAGPKPTAGRFLRIMCVEALIGAAMLALWPALTYAFGGGERGFLYLTWHSKRGLQLEAPAAFPVLLADPTVEFGSSYGSFNLRGETPDRVAKWMGVLMPLSALAGMFIAARGFWLASQRGVTALIPHVAASSLLIWMLFIAFNKVGSPQYLIWVAPLAPLLPLRTWAERLWGILFLVVLLATMLIYPCAYKDHIVGQFLHDDPLTWVGPSRLGVFLLGVKSVTLVAAAVSLAVLVWRNPPLGRSVDDASGS